MAAVEIVRAYAALVALAPLITEAIRAETEAPGYGADATVFRAVMNEIQVMSDGSNG